MGETRDRDTDTIASIVPGSILRRDSIGNDMLISDPLLTLLNVSLSMVTLLNSQTLSDDAFHSGIFVFRIKL